MIRIAEEPELPPNTDPAQVFNLARSGLGLDITPVQEKVQKAEAAFGPGPVAVSIAALGVSFVVSAATSAFLFKIGLQEKRSMRIAAIVLASLAGLSAVGTGAEIAWRI